MTVGTEVDLAAKEVADEAVGMVAEAAAVEIIILPQVSKEDATIVRSSRSQMVQ